MFSLYRSSGTKANKEDKRGSQFRAVSRRTAEMSELATYVEVKTAERRNRDDKRHSTRRMAPAEAHGTRVGPSALFNSNPVEWDEFKMGGLIFCRTLHIVGQPRALPKPVPKGR